MSGCAGAEVRVEVVPKMEPGLPSKEIHERAIASFRCRQKADRAHIFYLRQVETRGVYRLMGYRDMIHYGEAVFGYSARKIRDMLRVGEALEDLPRIAGAFESGKVDWTKVREVTQVAVPETEKEWLEAATKLTSRELEQRVAAARRGQKPKRRRHGFPQTWVPMQGRFRPHEVGLIEKAMEKLGERTGEKVGFRELVATLAQGYLERDEDAEGNAKPPSPVHLVVTYRCPACRRSYVETRDGPLPVSEKEVEEALGAGKEVHLEEEKEEPAAHVGKAAGAEVTAEDAHVGIEDPAHVGVQIDRPTSAALRRKVILRDHGHCQFPGCRSRTGLQAHHLKARIEGGPTVKKNLTTVCRVHHGLVWDGLIVVEGEAPDGLTWRRGDGSPIECVALPPEERVTVPAPSPGDAAHVGTDEEPFVIPDRVDAAWWRKHRHRFRWNDRKGCFEVIG